MIQVFHFCSTRSVRLDVAHIANMPCVHIGSRMRLLRWIKVSAGRVGIGCAAIAELMDVKSVLARSEARDFRMDLHSVGNFNECDRAANLVALGGMKHSDGF